MRRRALMGLALLSPVQSVFGQSADMRTFRAQVLQMLRQSYPDMRAKAGKDDSTIEIEAGTIDLTNIHATVRQLPADRRQAAIDDFIERLFQGLDKSRRPNKESWAEASKLLRARLVSPDMRLMVPDLLLRSFAPGALAAYVLDLEQQVEYVRRDLLAAWGVDSQRVHEIAVANLEFLSEAVSIEASEARGGGLFAIISTNDSYDAARLLSPRFRGRLLEALGDPIFVGIPNRDFLVAWSSDNAQFANFVARVVEDFGQQPYPITDTIYRVDREGVRSATAEERRRR